MKRTRARACTGKKPHDDRTAALSHIYALKRSDGAVRMSPYRCPYCRKWHVGHLPRRRR